MRQRAHLIVVRVDTLEECYRTEYMQIALSELCPVWHQTIFVSFVWSRFEFFEGFCGGDIVCLFSVGKCNLSLLGLEPTTFGLIFQCSTSWANHVLWTQCLGVRWCWRCCRCAQQFPAGGGYCINCPHSRRLPLQWRRRHPLPWAGTPPGLTSLCRQLMQCHLVVLTHTGVRRPSKDPTKDNTPPLPLQW